MSELWVFCLRIPLLIHPFFSLVGSILISRSIQGPSDEEYVTTFLWILERALHNEAFLGQMNLLKELKFKVSKIKLMFVDKPQYGKSIPAPINKGRWAKPNTAIPPPINNLTMERKNSATSLSSYSAMAAAGGADTSQMPPPTPQQQQQHLKRLDEKNYFNGMVGAHQPQQSYSKSSSYPSFAQNLKYSSSHAVQSSAIMSQNKLNVPVVPEILGQNNNQGGQQQPAHFSSQQQQLGLPPVNSGTGGNGNTMYHRHSMNSLMPLTGTLGNGFSGTGGSQDNKTLPEGGGGAKAERENNENIDIGNQCKDKNNICDINSRLEFLCLQMTEQAIN